MNKIILKIGGMSCSGCAAHVEKFLNKQKGVIKASVNLVMAQAYIEYDDSLTISQLGNFITESGYKYEGIYDEKDEDDGSQDKTLYYLIGLGILAVILMYISMAHMFNLPIIKYLNIPLVHVIVLCILIIPYLIFGFDIFKIGIKKLLNKAPNMDTLVTIGVLASLFYSLFGMIMILFGNNSYMNNLYFESCAIIILFVKIGRYIDNKSKKKTKEAIKQLVQITPQTALIKKNNNEKEITIDEVKKGDILIVKPGMKVAVDGVIVEGTTHLDESFINGESTPIKKQKGDKVIAGSINYDGYILYKAEKIGKDSTISEIVRLVVEAVNTKAPIARLADKVSSYFVPGIMVLAILTFIVYLLLGNSFNESLVSFVTVLVVACPCALGLATPLAIVISQGLCAKNGILVKSSEILEKAHKIDTIVFDKTGTLTYGNLKISKIFNYSKYSDNELIALTTSLESKSTHPIAKAFQDYSKQKNLKINKATNIESISGIGLSGKINNTKIYVGSSRLMDKLKIKNMYSNDEAKLSKLGNSIVYIIEDQKIIGLIGVKDIVRTNAKSTISNLYKINKNVLMLTGDNDKVAQIVAKTVGIKDVKARIMPKEKAKVIKELMQNEQKVMMIGDGINDALSLAIADIGVSFNSGTYIAADSADVILTNNNLEKIITFISISKKTIKCIKQNLFWAFFYNILMIPIAVGILKPIGIAMNPMLASLAMTISSLTVVFNSLRLNKKV